MKYYKFETVGFRTFTVSVVDNATDAEVEKAVEDKALEHGTTALKESILKISEEKYFLITDLNVIIRRRVFETQVKIDKVKANQENFVNRDDISVMELFRVVLDNQRILLEIMLKMDMS